MSGKRNAAALAGARGAETHYQNNDTTKIISVLSEVQRAAATPEPPEYRGEWRRFIVAMLMLGAIPSERLTAHIVAELAKEATEYGS